MRSKHSFICIDKSFVNLAVVYGQQTIGIPDTLYWLTKSTGQSLHHGIIEEMWGWSTKGPECVQLGAIVLCGMS